MTKEARQFAAILKGWGPSLQRAIAKANSNRWPSGAPGGKGGQYAPSKGGGAAPYSTSGMGFKPKQLSLFNYTPEPKAEPKPAASSAPAFAPMGSWGSWGGSGGAPSAPKAPPPGAKPHLQVDDKGQPVTINYPTKPSDPGTWKSADATATFVPGGPVPAVLHGVPMKPWADAPQRLHEWANVPGQRPEIDRDFPLDPAPGKSVGAGVIIEEADGRIWLTKPTNHFGGYQQTFPKGTVEHGLSLQASAIKEAYEETGLKIEITGVLGDFERTTSVARFYLAKRVGGSPAKMGWETQALRLAPVGETKKFLNMGVDQAILDDYLHLIGVKKGADRGTMEAPSGARKSLLHIEPWASKERQGEGAEIGRQHPIPAGANSQKEVFRASAGGSGVLTKSAGSSAGEPHQRREDRLPRIQSGVDHGKGQHDARYGSGALQNDNGARARKPGEYLKALAGAGSGNQEQPAVAAQAGGNVWRDEERRCLHQVGEELGGLALLAKAQEEANLLHFLEKATGKAGGHWEHQARWPAGTPLGGQWKSVGQDGLTLPPTIAGGLDGKNPAYQKKANALHAMAQSGDHKNLLDSAIQFEKKVKADADAGKKSTHVKWNAQVSQYANQLVKDVLVKPQAEATAAKISGPDKLSDYTKVGAKPGGSNDGAVYADKDGVKWLVKGNNYAGAGGTAMSDDRAKNEVLASKLMAAAGIPGPEIKLVDLEGKHQGNLGVAVKWLDGLKSFNPNDAAQLAAVQSQFAVHAWLGNWDVLGMGLDNTMFKDGSAINIDPGGSILFRAQGAPKKEGLFDKSASDWESMRSTDQHQKSVYGSMSASQLQESAKHLANVSDDTINKLVDAHGPGDLKAKVALASTLRARRDAILEKAGLKTIFIPDVEAKDAVPAPPPEPPKISDAVPAPAGTPLPAGITKPEFNSGYKKTDDHYTGLADKAEALHAAGDLAGLKGMVDMKKNPGTWGGTTFSSKKLQAFHSALVADLEGKQQQAAAQVSAGQATVTDAKGQEWKATDGVLNPVAPTAKPLTFGHVKNLYLQSQMNHGTTAGGALENWKDALKNDDLAATLAEHAITGNLALVKQYPEDNTVSASFKTFKHSVIAAMTGAAASPSGTKLDRGQALGVIQDHLPSYTTHDQAKNSTSSIGVMYNAALKGDLNTIAALKDSDMGMVLTAIKADYIAAMTPQAAPAAPAATAPAPKPALPDFEKQKLPSTNTNAASHNSKVEQIATLAKSGSVKAILAMNFGTNTYGKKQATLANDVLASLGSPHQVTAGQKANSHPALVNGTAQNAPVTAAVQPLPKPAEPVAKPKPVFKPELLTTPPTFTASSVPAVNEANIAAAKAIFAAAQTGDLHAVQNLKFEQLDKATQQKTGVLLSFDQHPSSGVQNYYSLVQDEMNDQLNGGSGVAIGQSIVSKEWRDISAATPPVAMGAGVKAVPTAQKVGLYIVLGKAPKVPTVKTISTIMGGNTWAKWAKTHYNKASHKATSVFSHYVTSSGAGEINTALRKGNMDGTLHNGMGKKEYVELFNKELAVDIPEGARFVRMMGTSGFGSAPLSHADVKKIQDQIIAAGPGTVIQEPGFSSSSHGTKIMSGNEIQWNFTAGQGVKAFPAWLHANTGEGESLFPPNQRYLITGTKKSGNKLEIEALLLPTV